MADAVFNLPVVLEEKEALDKEYEWGVETDTARLKSLSGSR